MGVGAFFLGHRVDQGDLTFQHLVVKSRSLGLFRHAAHAGQHAHHGLHTAHLEHLVKLALEVVHVEQTLLEPLHRALGLLQFDGFLRALDEGDDIAHAKDAARDAFRLERLKRVHLFAKADEADRLAGDGAHRQGGATASVAVHPGQGDAGDADLAVKLGGDVDGVLPGEAIDHQHHLTRGGDVADGFDLVHQRLVDVQAAGGVEDVDVIAAEVGLGFGAFGDLNGGFAFDDRQGIDADLRAEDLQLLHRRRAVGVERGHQHPLAVFLFQTLGELGGGGGLARALQADHQDRRGRVVDLHRVGLTLAAQGVDQRVMDDFHDLLAGGDGFGDSLAGRLGLHGGDEIARDREGDVSL
ncbi:hypothetical protein GALL_486080 [mine drainage metagenome]|uniref:NAD-specific glutamate dehydrogenase n=1 Tax=mine drainage metagenome TaxID=410659 RepID=A0A1J5PQD8_9ZZZZ